MKKSKHFRKDVIIARIIFAVLCLVVGILIGTGISALVKSTEKPANTEQRTETQKTEAVYPEVEIEPETEVETEAEPEVEVVLYVVPSTEVRVRKEPNTSCAILDRIPAGTKTLFLEELDGWYKVEHNGQVGYISADYAEVVEETISAN